MFRKHRHIQKKTKQKKENNSCTIFVHHGNTFVFITVVIR